MIINEIERFVAKALADSDLPEEKALPLLENNTVVCDNKSVSRLILSPEYGDDVTLSDLRSMHSDAKKMLVISEFPLRGEVYRFGNHGDVWEKVGDTCGYA